MIGIYAAKNVDGAIRASSSSGGVFRALCQHVLDMDGVVYGARYDSTMRVVHGRATSAEECIEFSGSKYVQSTLGTSFERVRTDLEAGDPVLFSGTPCQVAGLKSFLRLSRVGGTLLTVEVVCHGVPSPRLWRDHVAFVEEHAGAKVRDFLFRDKEQGWRGVRYRAITDRGPVRSRQVAAFGDLFNTGNALRPSCHECPFAKLDRVADLTLGDYWGIERHYPEFDDNKGVSVVLVNTRAGLDAFEGIRAHLDCFEIEVEECLQPNLLRPTPPSKRRASFWRTYGRAGYVQALRRYTSYGFLRRHLRRVRSLAGGLLR